MTDNIIITKWGPKVLLQWQGAEGQVKCNESQIAYARDSGKQYRLVGWGQKTEDDDRFSSFNFRLEQSCKDAMGEICWETVPHGFLSEHLRDMDYAAFYRRLFTEVLKSLAWSLAMKTD